MNRYFEYLKIVLKHKWFVFLGCLKIGAPLYLAVFHDMSKLSILEFVSYARQFYNSDGTKRNVRNLDGSYDPNAQAISFQRAWLNHQRNNKHHWEAWCVIGDYGVLSALPMPEKYIREMIADWIGAGLAYNNKADPTDWYKANRNKMVLHEDTLKIVDELISKLPSAG